MNMYGTLRWFVHISALAWNKDPVSARAAIWNLIVRLSTLA